MVPQEIRYALRLLLKNPGFTAIAALSLALGIGANTAIFSLADALLLRPLPVVEPSRVVTISTDSPNETFGVGGVSYPDYRDLRAARSFDGMAAMKFSVMSLAKSAKESPQMRMGLMVSDNFFSAMGVQPMLGRAFLPEEGEVPGRNPVVILSYDFWRSEFGADASVVNRMVRINGIDFNVVGVLGEDFTGMDEYVRPHFYVPVMMWQRLTGTPDNPLEDRGNHVFDVKGRLRAGVTREQARAELAALWKGLEPLHTESDRSRVVAVRTELQGRIQQSPPDAYLIFTLMALVAVVLTIACANVANLLLGRARARTREVAIRIALGATRARLIRQLLTESVMLALVGATAGLGFAYAAIRFLRTIRIPTDIPIVIRPELNERVLLFSLLSAIASAVIFGLAPALQTSKADLVPALKSAEAAGGKRRMLGRNALVIAQVAMSMVLLVASAMMIEGFRKALVVDPGFRIDHLLTMELDTSLTRYTPAQSHDFFRDLGDRARAVPGVRRVALGSVIPMNPGQDDEKIVPEGYQFPKGVVYTSSLVSVVDENYFDVLKTPLLRGRAFTAQDKEGAPPVVIVNEQFATKYWPNQDALGKRLRIVGQKDKEEQWMQVVGVAKTGKYTFVAESPMTFLYLPYRQNPRQRMVLFAESAGDPASVASPLRELVRGMDVNMPIFNVRTFSEFYQMRAIANLLLIVELVATMGAIGLTLALIGLYGLVAFSVARRTREIGVRMAIGARPGDVLRMVLRQGAALALGGIVFGSAVSIAVGRLLAVGLVGLGKPSPVTYFVVPAVLMMVTLASCYVPARRAARIDPMEALRYE